MSQSFMDLGKFTREKIFDKINNQWGFKAHRLGIGSCGGYYKGL